MVEDEEFIAIIKVLVSSQFLLESLDALKDTPVYRQRAVNLTKKLEKELEYNVLKSHFKHIFLENEETFSTLLRGFENITSTLTKEFSLVEIVDLSEKLMFMKDSVEISKEEFLELKELYHKNVKEGNEVFTFKGREVLVSYAKYLIEYLSSTLK